MADEHPDIFGSIRGEGLVLGMPLQPQDESPCPGLRALADHNIEYYGLRSDRPDALDTDGADTVRRGGMRWA